MFDYDYVITVMGTSTCISGASTDDVVPTTDGATSANGSSIRFDVGSRITSVAGCSATSEGAPLAPTIICPTKGTGTTVGGA